MPVGNLPKYVGTEPFPEFHHPLLMAGGTEACPRENGGDGACPARAGFPLRFNIGQKIFMVAIPALHPGKAVVQVATFQVAVNHLLEVGPPEPVRPFEPLLVDLNKDAYAKYQSFPQCQQKCLHAYRLTFQEVSKNPRVIHKSNLKKIQTIL